MGGGRWAVCGGGGRWTVGGIRGVYCAVADAPSSSSPSPSPTGTLRAWEGGAVFDARLDAMVKAGQRLEVTLCADNDFYSQQVGKEGGGRERERERDQTKRERERERERETRQRERIEKERE